MNNKKINKYVFKKKNTINKNKIDYYNKKILFYGGSSSSQTIPNADLICNSYHEYQFYKKKFMNYNRNYIYILTDNIIFLLNKNIIYYYNNNKYISLFERYNSSCLNMVTDNNSICNLMENNLIDISYNIDLDNITHFFNNYSEIINVYKFRNELILLSKNGNIYSKIANTFNNIFKIYNKNNYFYILFNDNQVLYIKIDSFEYYKNKYVDLYISNILGIYALGLLDNGNIKILNNTEDTVFEELDIVEIFNAYGIYAIIHKNNENKSELKIMGDDFYYDSLDESIIEDIIHIYFVKVQVYYIALLNNRKINIFGNKDFIRNIKISNNDFYDVVDVFFYSNIHILLFKNGEIDTCIERYKIQCNIINRYLIEYNTDIFNIYFFNEDIYILLKNNVCYIIYNETASSVSCFDNYQDKYDTIYLNINNFFLPISKGIINSYILNQHFYHHDDEMINESTSFLNSEYYSNLTVSLYHTDITDFDNITIFDCQQLYDLTRITKIYKHKDNYILFYNNIYYYLYNKNKLFHKIFYNEKHNLFATLHLNNTIHLWSDTHSSIITEKIITISQIYNNENSFAILFKSGLVKIYKANSNNKFEFILQIDNISYICNNSNSFALLTRDGQVKIYTNQLIELLYENIIYIFNNEFAYAFLSNEGTVNVWGNADYGGSFNNDFQELNNVEYIYNNDKSFAALLKDSSVKVWGDHNIGGFISLKTNEKLNDIHYIYSNKYSYAALLHSGEVVSWGDPSKGGFVENLIDVNYIFSNDSSYIAIKNDKTVYAWGDIDNQDKNAMIDLKVLYIFNKNDSYAILSIDGTIHSYGKNRYNNTNSFYFSPKYDKYIDKICEKYNIENLDIINNMEEIVKYKYELYNHSSSNLEPNPEDPNNVGIYDRVEFSNHINIPFNIENLLSYYEIMKFNIDKKENFIEGTGVDAGGLTKSFFTNQCIKLEKKYIYKLNNGEYIFNTLLDYSIESFNELIYLGFVIGRMIMLGLDIPFKFNCSIIYLIKNHHTFGLAYFKESITHIKTTKLNTLTKEKETLIKEKNTFSDLETIKIIDNEINKLEQNIDNLNMMEFDDNIDYRRNQYMYDNISKNIDYIQDYELFFNNNEKNKDNSSNIKSDFFKHDKNNLAEYYFIKGLSEVLDRFHNLENNINCYYNCGTDFYLKIIFNLKNDRLKLFFLQNINNFKLLKRFYLLATGLKCANNNILYTNENVFILFFHTCSNTVGFNEETLEEKDSNGNYILSNLELMTFIENTPLTNFND